MENIIGRWEACHTHWTGVLNIEQGGVLNRIGVPKSSGAWSLDGNKLEIKWKDWPTENLYFDGKEFKGKENFKSLRKIVLESKLETCIWNNGGLGDKICALAAAREWAKLNRDRKVLFPHLFDIIAAYGDDLIHFGNTGFRIEIGAGDRRRVKNKSPDGNYLGTFLSDLKVPFQGAFPSLSLPNVSPLDVLMGKKYIAFQPLSVWAKNPPDEFIKSILLACGAKYPGVKIIVVGNPNTVKAWDGVDYSFLENSPLQMLKVIKYASLVLSPKSASATIAAGYLCPSFVWLPDDGENWHMNYPNWPSFLAPYSDPDCIQKFIAFQPFI